MMDDFDRPATQAEAYQEMVGNIGSDNPDNEWILTPYDTWERNPAYTGPRGPHPEDLGPDDCYDIGGLEFREELSDEELEALTKPETHDNIPF
jgi:hypothetical protein